MTRVLFTNCHLTRYRDGEYNKGSAAVMASSIRILKDLMPDSRFTTFVQYSEGFAREHDLRVVESRVHHTRSFSVIDSVISTIKLSQCILWNILNRFTGLDGKFLLTGRHLREMRETDIVVDLSMDLYSDNLGTLSILEHSKELLCAILLKKPVVVFAQSLGPFRGKISSLVARYTLNKVDLITVREAYALEHLIEAGIKGPHIHFTADPAFLLEPAGTNRVKEILADAGITPGERPLVGLTLTPTILAKAMEDDGSLKIAKRIYTLLQYVLPESVMKSLDRLIQKTSIYKDASKKLGGIVDALGIIDHVTKQLSANVLLIPHTITPPEDLGPLGDDMSLAKEIYGKAGSNPNVKILSKDYSTEEIKGVIGACDLFVGAKMHANIAALSQEIPVVGISYSHKFRGIMKMAGMEDYLCSGMDAKEVTEKIDLAWKDSKGIKKKLKATMPGLKELSLKNGRLVKGLLEKSQYAGFCKEPSGTRQAHEERAPLT